MEAFGFNLLSKLVIWHQHLILLANKYKKNLMEIDETLDLTDALKYNFYLVSTISWFVIDLLAPLNRKFTLFHLQ
jgi:hypothetical protein